MEATTPGFHLGLRFTPTVTGDVKTLRAAAAVAKREQFTGLQCPARHDRTQGDDQMRTKKPTYAELEQTAALLNKRRDVLEKAAHDMMGSKHEQIAKAYQDGEMYFFYVSRLDAPSGGLFYRTFHASSQYRQAPTTDINYLDDTAEFFRQNAGASWGWAMEAERDAVHKALQMRAKLFERETASA